MRQGNFKYAKLELIVALLANGKVVENKKEFSRRWISNMGERYDGSSSQARGCRNPLGRRMIDLVI